MAALKPEVRAFIVQELACFDTPSQIVESVQKEFKVQVTRQQVASHDPTKVAGKGLAQKWVDLFNRTRDRFLNEISDIPIANKAYRLRVLQRMSPQRTPTTARSYPASSTKTGRSQAQPTGC